MLLKTARGRQQVRRFRQAVRSMEQYVISRIFTGRLTPSRKRKDNARNAGVACPGGQQCYHGRDSDRWLSGKIARYVLVDRGRKVLKYFLRPWSRGSS